MVLVKVLELWGYTARGIGAIKEGDTAQAVSSGFYAAGKSVGAVSYFGQVGGMSSQTGGTLTIVSAGLQTTGGLIDVLSSDELSDEQKITQSIGISARGASGVLQGVNQIMGNSSPWLMGISQGLSVASDIIMQGNVYAGEIISAVMDILVTLGLFLASQF